MSCFKCKSPDSKEEPLLTCDKCKGKLCQTCAKLSTTEYRAASLKSGRTLLYLCLVCRPIVNLNQTENEKLKEVQIDLHTLNKKFTDFSKTTLQLIEKIMENDNNNILKTIQKEIQLLKDDLRKSIERTKQEVINIKETNKDMIRLLSNSASLPKPYSEVVSNTTSQNRYIHKPQTNKSITVPMEKPITQQSQQKLIQHNSTSGTSNTLHIPIQNSFNSHPKKHENINSDGFIEIKSRRSRQKKYQLGTNTSTDINESGFEGRISTQTSKDNQKKKLWLFISRAKGNVTEEIVKKYIHVKTKADPIDISVKLLKTFYQKEDNNCFLIGVDPTFQEMVYQQNFWPQGVAFQRFNFKKGQHFLDNPRQMNTGLNNNSFDTENSVFT